MNHDGPMKRIVDYRRARDRPKMAEEHWCRSQDKLRREAEEAVRTTMIGSISLLEQVFGHLWGQGDEPINEQEWEMDGLRRYYRENILNLGNNRIRALRSTLDRYFDGTLT